MKNKEVSIYVSGDFCPINRVETYNSSNSEIDLYGTLFPIIKGSDLSITNLECPLTTCQVKITKTGPSLKAKPTLINYLKEAGFNLVTLANNHIMDYGQQGLKDTLEILDKNKIAHVGAEMDGFRALNIFYFIKNDVKIAILNFAENEWSTTKDEAPGANPVNAIKNFYSIQEAKKNADAVVVINHGGNELSHLPSPGLKDRLHFYVDAGADCVINHHTHFISGYERYKDIPIFYSLGNFIFDNPNYRNSDWNIGMAVQLNWKENKFDFELFTFDQCNEHVGIKEHNQEKKKITLEKIAYLNKIIVDDNQLKEHYKLYIKQKKRMYLSYLEPHKNKYLLALQNRNLFPRLWSNKKKLLLLNLIRCESHHEALIRTLENETSHTS